MSFANAVSPLRPSPGRQDVLSQLAAELERIRFGSIHLPIHDGKVVQFDITEKRRLG